MTIAPTTDASGTISYAEYWRIRNIVVENNLIELALSAPPLPPSYGVYLADTQDQTSLDIYLQSVIRGNVIRELNDVPDPNSFGIGLVKSGSALIEQNVIDPAVGTPIEQNHSGVLQYFDNATPAGVLLQGYDEQNSRKVDELATRVEESLLISI